MKTIGVLGGMGPEATNQFLTWITALTPAQKDQDHIPVLCYNNSQIPDRTSAILNGAPSPLAELIRSAQVLERAGAELLAMPCNTAHYFYDELVQHVKVPFPHLLHEAVSAARAVCPGGRRLGLLATAGTVRSGIYRGPAADQGFELVVPDEREQAEWVGPAIAAIKQADKAQARTLLRNAAERLIQRGAEVLVAGCTEIPLVLTASDASVPLVDPAEALARRSIQLATSALVMAD